jgi:cyclopropane-fatty-acyl-phospholipid synthase
MSRTAWYEPLLDRQLVPDPVVRAGIRQLLRARIRDEARLDRKARFIDELRHSAVALHPGDANTQHYDVPVGFFKLVLGPHLKYSSGLWEPGTETLAGAEAAMLALTAERAGIANGQHILELGSGWGSLTLYLAERFPASRLVAVTNSVSQRAYVEGCAASRGLKNVTVVACDVNTFDPGPHRFDRVVSVEMFEHVRNYDTLLERISRWLEPEGRLFVHIFAHRQFAYPFETEGAGNWMAAHFFTGGTMPSDDLLSHFDDHLQVEAQWRVNGLHYARTCDAWLANLDANREQADAVLSGSFEPTGGSSSADARRHRARWRVFFMACSELFRYNGGDEWFVAHYSLRHRS